MAQLKVLLATGLLSHSCSSLHTGNLVVAKPFATTPSTATLSCIHAIATKRASSYVADASTHASCQPEVLFKGSTHFWLMFLRPSLTFSAMAPACTVAMRILFLQRFKRFCGLLLAAAKKVTYSAGLERAES